jgi:hypothetical protein
MLVLVDLPKCPTNMLMMLLIHLIMLLAAMGWVSTIRAFVSRRLAALVVLLSLSILGM